jgi:hypothetical protein
LRKFSKACTGARALADYTLLKFLKDISFDNKTKKNGYQFLPVNRFRRRTDEEIIRLSLVYARPLPNENKN